MDRFPFQGLTVSSVFRDMSIMGSRQMIDRRSHGFIIKLRGITEYRTETACWLLNPGQILYVPKGHSYAIREVEKGYSYVVNFECDCSCDMMLLPLPSAMDITLQAEKLYNSFQHANPYATLSALYQILEKVGHGYSSSGEKTLLEPVLAYLRANLTDPGLDISVLPGLAQVSPAYLRRIFRKRYGVSPTGYVVRERMRLAQQLLCEEPLTVAQVATAVGYRDCLYFSRLFKKQLGLSPSKYRAQCERELF